jgi:hypothetical protein
MANIFSVPKITSGYTQWLIYLLRAEDILQIYPMANIFAPCVIFPMDRYQEYSKDMLHRTKMRKYINTDNLTF